MRSIALLLASSILLVGCQNSGVTLSNPLAETAIAKNFGKHFKRSPEGAAVIEKLRASDWRLQEGAEATASRGYRAKLKGQSDTTAETMALAAGSGQPGGAAHAALNSSNQTAAAGDAQFLAMNGSLAAPPRFRAETGRAVTHFHNLLVTTTGMTLYTFSGDLRNTPRCVDACNLRFQPYLVQPNAPTYHEYGHALRPEGYHQWAVKDQPLYTFIGDAKPGDRNAEGLEGRWYAVPYPFEGGSPIVGLEAHMPNAPKTASAPIIPSLASPPAMGPAVQGLPGQALGGVGAVPVTPAGFPADTQFSPIPQSSPASAPVAPVLQQSQAPATPVPPWPRSAEGLPVAQPFYKQ